MMRHKSDVSISAVTQSDVNFVLQEAINFVRSWSESFLSVVGLLRRPNVAFLAFVFFGIFLLLGVQLPIAIGCVSGLLLLMHRTISNWVDDLPDPFGKLKFSSDDVLSYFREEVGRTILIARRSDRDAEEENKRSQPIGCIAILSKNNKAAVLKHLTVTEADFSRRRQISRQLLRQAERFCAHHGYHKMELFLPVASSPGEAAENVILYESIGFQVEKRPRVFWAGWIPIADLVFMAKIIEMR